ncbi:TOM1-like protein 2, partial [Ananas comosus]
RQTKDVVKAVKKRLQSKNPRVQFLALTLLETMMKNCGDYVHSEVVGRDILQEMINIAMKTSDGQVRHKILLLLDSWQEAFGPGGRHPQYYWAYVELKRYGVAFPDRPPNSPPILTPSRLSTTSPRYYQPPYGSSSNSSRSLNEVMASDVANLSLSHLKNIRNVSELLNEMLREVNPNNRESVKDEVIVDLVNQCRTNQKKIMELVSSTGDEELLGEGLALNDSLQSLLAKHDAIASGSPLPIEAPVHRPIPKEPVKITTPAIKKFEDEADDDDGFAQLAQRNLRANKSAQNDDHEVSSNKSDLTSLSTNASTSDEASSSVASNALVPLDPPISPVKTIDKEQDMIDFLAITLSENPNPSPAPIPNESPTSAPPIGVGQPSGPQPFPQNEAYNPYNSYVAPWAQKALPPPQPQPYYTYSYPPPPWAYPGSSNPSATPSTSSYQVPASTTVPTPQPMQRYNSFGSSGAAFGSSGVNNVQTTAPEPQASVNSKPYYMPDRLFEDLIDLKSVRSGNKMSNTSTGMSGASGQPMIGGRK